MAREFVEVEVSNNLRKKFEEYGDQMPTDQAMVELIETAYAAGIARGISLAIAGEWREKDERTINVGSYVAIGYGLPLGRW